MSTQPVEELLHKPYDNAQLIAVLGDFANAIDETVNFGTHVLKWSADGATEEPEDAPLLMLLRHELGLADAVSVLVRNSCIEPAAILLRSMLETLLAAEYILEKDCHRRGLAFVLLNLIRDDLKWLDKADGTSPAGKQFRKAITSDRLAGRMELVEIPDLPQRKLALQDKLSSPKYQEVEAEYQRVLSAGAGRPAWHSLFGGPRDIEQLARHLGHSAMYEVLYRPWSGSAHAIDVFRGKVLSTSDGKAAIASLRSPKDAEEPTKFAMSFSLVLFQLFLKHYAPGRVKELSSWYRSIRPFYLDISQEKPKIHVNPP